MCIAGSKNCCRARFLHLFYEIIVKKGLNVRWQYLPTQMVLTCTFLTYNKTLLDGESGCSLWKQSDSAFLPQVPTKLYQSISIHKNVTASCLIVITLLLQLAVDPKIIYQDMKYVSKTS